MTMKLILQKINILKTNNLKKYLVIFLSTFSFFSAIGIFFSISSSADSNPKLVWLFLILGFISFLVLLTVTVIEIIRLFSNFRNKRAGSELQTRIVAVFGLIAFTPVLIVAIFAAIFFEKGIEGWFSKRVETALIRSSAIAENYSRETKKRVEGDALFISLKLSNFNGINFNNRIQVEYILNNLAIERGANELAVISSNGKVISASRNSYFLPNNIAPNEIFSSKENSSSPIIFLETNNNLISVITPIIGHIGLYLYFSRYLDPVITYNLKSVNDAIKEYTLAKQQSDGNRITFTMVFLSVSLLLLLLAIWLGIAFANSLTYPISLLINGSEKISKGNLNFKIPDEKYKNNEIFKLIKSFNIMIKQLFDQRKELVTANKQIDDRRRFTESVLTGVKSGVLGVDFDDSIFLVNRSALELLETDASKLIGVKVFDIFPDLLPLIKEIKIEKDKLKEKQIDYRLKGRKKTFIIGISFENQKDYKAGYVVTIENITELIKVQRSAAWADIARKIAHEIKNPLTPIQLSADRLKHKYLTNIKDDKDIFVNCIDTIIRQVATMHRMVNEFSTFAKMPRPIFQNVDMKEIIAGNVSMTKLANKDIEITSNVELVKLSKIKADSNLINQAFNNLVKNSINAIKERQNKLNEKEFPGKINIELSENNSLCLLKVTDNGIGLPEDKEHLTEPYISRNKKGSGLGLAVVKKIMEDHKGFLELNNNNNNVGANVTLLFPIETN